MPKRDFGYSRNRDMYSASYEQYYFNDSPKKIKPIKRNKKKKGNSLQKIISITFFAFLLFYVLPFSFRNYIVNVFPQNENKMLNINYEKFLFPTNEYLYKDLFLGKYIIKDTEYSHYIMKDMPETYERKILKTRLQALANEYRRLKPSIYVWDYENSSYVNIEGETIYPAASIIKLPVLIEMFREIERGEFTLSDKMILEDYYRASGSGKLQYSQGGIAHTMDYLARIMIENSDNSSTNMIIAKIGGMPEVNRAMKHWGLKNTHISNWLPDLDGTNTTTSKELVKMFYNIDTTNIISNQSKRHIADYLGHVKNNRLLQAGLPKNAILLHKTGDIGFMLGDAGIVKTHTGKKYIVAILVKRPYNSQQGKNFIVKASKIIYDNIAY
ncbi:MAG: serine hydrolase [Cyanobacteria bacterium SIG29]|nr:serine hydrolase [Cyanobacteria bacterium SIG29]